MSAAEREKLRTVLKYRADAAVHFDTARVLGPQVRYYAMIAKKQHTI
jgi:hypothetical protein